MSTLTPLDERSALGGDASEPFALESTLATSASPTVDPALPLTVAQAAGPAPTEPLGQPETPTPAATSATPAPATTATPAPAPAPTNAAPASTTAPVAAPATPSGPPTAALSPAPASATAPLGASPVQHRAPEPPKSASRNLTMAATVLVALIATATAYLAMVSFGTDILQMPRGTAYATAGVFELSLITVALLAREAAKDNRPAGVLLTLTWVLSSASGGFAAYHEFYGGHPVGSIAFRIATPLLAALMWHLALIGDRHLASGTTWTGARQTARMHALFLTTEDLFRAHAMNDGTKKARHRLDKADAARRHARAVALRTVPPEEMRARVNTWIDSLKAVGEGTADVARLHSDDRLRLNAILGEEEVAAAAADTALAAEMDRHADTAANLIAAEVLPPADDAAAAGGTEPAALTATPSAHSRVVTARTGGDQETRVSMEANVGTGEHSQSVTSTKKAVPAAKGEDAVEVLGLVWEAFVDNRDITNGDLADHLSGILGVTVSDRTARRRIQDLGGRDALKDEVLALQAEGALAVAAEIANPKAIRARVASLVAREDAAKAARAEAKARAEEGLREPATS